VPNCSDRSTSIAVAGSSAPRRAELRTSETNSCGERADRSSSAGSMPKRRNSPFAVPLVSLISGVNIAENTTCGPATVRAVASGRATARYCATSSPNTIDTEVAISRARPSAVPSATCLGTPISVSTGANRRASSGSARYPVTSVVIEMPICAPES